MTAVSKAAWDQSITELFGQRGELIVLLSQAYVALEMTHEPHLVSSVREKIHDALCELVRDFDGMIANCRKEARRLNEAARKQNE